ncbi:MAG: hypothetical protein GYB58_20910 [Gammaproteobacteria bacterium]|nr:hypothetical protein [Gammaproteobacteria bacterium]
MLRKLTAVLMLVVAGPLLAGDDSSGFYQRYDNEAAVVEHTIAQAVENHQLVALVLGAQWCHDSRALAGYLNDPALAPVTKNIALLPVDVGYLENKHALLSQFGYPAYFATPTLLLIDPQTRRVINRASLPAWQSAHNESAAALQDYLQAQLQYWESQWQPGPIVPEVEAFETQQANRLYEDYQRLGKLLAKEDAGQPVPALNARWRAVKQYRMALQADLIRMHQEGEIGDKTPNYSPIDW